MFKKKRDKTQRADAILGDLMRGQEGRSHKDNHQSHGYFEDPEVLAHIGFNDHAGDNFLGIVGGTTKKIIRADGRSEYMTTGGVPVGCIDDRHHIIGAGNRSGKGRSVLIPELLTYAGSIIANDCKGELAAITARYRAENLGQKSYILDPFGITPKHCRKYRARFNPLRLINMKSPTMIEDAALIADALVVAHDSKSAHWDESARAFIEAMILFVAYSDFPEEKKTLPKVAELIAGKHGSITWLLKEMEIMGGPDDRVAAAACVLKDMGNDERGSVLSTARRNLNFLNFDAMVSSLSGHDFELEDLKNEAMTIYLVLPAMRMGTCKQWLRLFVNLTLAAMEKNPARPRYAVRALLDEMPVLGYMKELENAIGQMAGLGLRITSVVQDLGQLKALYKDRFETFMGNAGILQFFGIADYYTSEWISKYLGKTTIKISERSSQSLDAKNKGASGVHYRNQTLDLMTPEEVRRYFARDDHMNRQLVCIPGRRPYILQRANYDQHEIFKGRFDAWR